MTTGVVGRKCDMTRIFTEKGVSILVTAIEAESSRVAQFKTEEIDGYRAVQVTTGKRHASRVTKAQAGHFAKANAAAGRGVWEFRLGEKQYAAGNQITVDLSQAGRMVDVTGGSESKGFASIIKRQNFRGQGSTHGNSVPHHVLGSIGQCQTPGRVFKGKKMSGHLGAEWVTIQSPEIVRVDVERNLLLVKGAAPGTTGGDVIVCLAVKARG